MLASSFEWTWLDVVIPAILQILTHNLFPYYGNGSNLYPFLPTGHGYKATTIPFLPNRTNPAIPQPFSFLQVSGRACNGSQEGDPAVDRQRLDPARDVQEAA